MNDLARLRELYIAVNKLMAYLGAYGEISPKSILADGVMDALRAIDGGIYDVAAFDALLTELEQLREAVSDAETVINRGVELMTYKQVGRWTGVRHWLETYAIDAAKEEK